MVGQVGEFVSFEPRANHFVCRGLLKVEERASEVLPVVGREVGVFATFALPNDSLDRLFWLYPEARFLMDSPVVALLRWLALQFEIDRGKGVTDSSPLTSLPEGLFR